MIKRRTYVLAAILLIGALLFAWVKYWEFWAVDRCLDSGGAWDYVAEKCKS